MSRPTVGNILTSVFVKMGLRADSEINLRMMACRELFLKRGLNEPEMEPAIPSLRLYNAS